ncbi:hypothetical protein AYI69_g2971 [Smittium culicis]|uniref:Potassium channel tetramerisation-type BTB domain-containing protein n=1 Tax=Smittium culicis TaxID=133412 RepID=A0A1R1YLJ0_9FUNG|nr:hypothetical protein AYI69_g2971 [Smittium culicis]
MSAVLDQKNYRPPNSNGEYFFDRNGKIFEFILNWYRSDSTDISDFFGEEKMSDSAVREELDYFLIPYKDSFASLAARITIKSTSILEEFSQTILKLCIVATESCMAEFALYPPKQQGDYHCYGKYEFDSDAIKNVGFTPVQPLNSGFGSFLPPPRPGTNYKIPIPCTLFKELMPARRFDNPSWADKVSKILKKQLPNFKIINDDYLWIITGFADEGNLSLSSSEIKGEKIATYPFSGNSDKNLAK